MKFKVALALLLFEPCWPSHAQQILGPNVLIGGTSAQCAGVVSTLDRDLKYIAASSAGQIRLRPDFFRQPRLKQLFIYAHECGHHVHGESESAADCYAVKAGRTAGWLTLQRLGEITEGDYWNKGDWPHAPGHIAPGKCWLAITRRNRAVAGIHRAALRGQENSLNVSSRLRPQDSRAPFRLASPGGHCVQSQMKRAPPNGITLQVTDSSISFGRCLFWACDLSRIWLFQRLLHVAA